MRAILAIIVGSILVSAGCQMPAPPTSKNAAAETQAIAVKAGAILGEYAANAVAADAKYKGNVIQVSGKFGSAQKAPLLGYAVQVLPDEAGDLTLSGVQCFILQSAEGDVAGLQPGQAVTLKGTCDGQVLGQLKVSKCVIVK